jgi:hypothetical protein
VLLVSVCNRGFDLLGRTVDSIRSEADLALAQVNTTTVSSANNCTTVGTNASASSGATVAATGMQCAAVRILLSACMNAR